MRDSQVIADFEAITAPIVVGTSKALARSIKKTKPSIREKILQNVSCVVCDEIDRLVDTLSKYATRREVSYVICYFMRYYTQYFKACYELQRLNKFVLPRTLMHVIAVCIESYNTVLLYTCNTAYAVLSRVAMAIYAYIRIRHYTA
jgi:hypothetical protein